jgi:hypothetical protein
MRLDYLVSEATVDCLVLFVAAFAFASVAAFSYRLCLKLREV